MCWIVFIQYITWEGKQTLYDEEMLWLDLLHFRRILRTNDNGGDDSTTLMSASTCTSSLLVIVHWWEEKVMELRKKMRMAPAIMVGLESNKVGVHMRRLVGGTTWEDELSKWVQLDSRLNVVKCLAEMGSAMFGSKWVDMWVGDEDEDGSWLVWIRWLRFEDGFYVL